MAASDQKPVNSGFHAHSTASEVLKGQDLSGKFAIVTGGYSGIGLETVRALANAGCCVTVPARRPDVAEKALSKLSGEIEIAQMDLADIKSIEKFTRDYEDTGRGLNFLINNAGIMACPLGRVGPGWETQFGVNHLGHMSMSLALAPSMQRADGSRLVALSSTGHIRSDIHWDDPNFNSHDYNKWDAYGQSKTANALFALGVDRRGREFGIRAFSVHPGGIFTDLQRHLPDEEMVALGWKNEDGTVPERIEKMFKTPEAGASTTVWAATSEKLANMGGVYCENCDIAELATDTSQRWEHARSWICDDASAERLWEISEKMLSEA